MTMAANEIFTVSFYYVFAIRKRSKVFFRRELSAASSDLFNLPCKNKKIKRNNGAYKTYIYKTLLLLSLYPASFFFISYDTQTKLKVM